jgi:hypothetical protein
MRREQKPILLFGEMKEVNLVLCPKDMTLEKSKDIAERVK